MKIINEQVQLKDIFHTILHLTGIKKPRNKYLEIEKSLIYQIDNEKTPKYIFGEYLKSKKNQALILSNYKTKYLKLLPRMLNHIYFLRSNRYKYIKYNNQNIEEFYDLYNDPHEKTNIFDQTNKKCTEMKEILELILKKNKNLNSLKKLKTIAEKNKLDNIINQLKLI